MKSKLLPLKIFHFTEDILSSLSLVLTALFPVLEVIARGVFHTGVYSSAEYVKHLVIFVTFLGAMITSREDRHLCFAVGIEHVSPPWKEWIQTANAMLSVVVTLFIGWSSVSFINTAFSPSDKLGFFPLQWAMYVMPLGFTVMLLRFVSHAPKGVLFKIIAASGAGVIALLGFICGPYLHFMAWPVAVVLSAGLFLGTGLYRCRRFFTFIFRTFTGFV